MVTAWARPVLAHWAGRRRLGRLSVSRSHTTRNEFSWGTKPGLIGPILAAMGNLLVRAFRAVNAWIEADLAVSEHALDCPHVELGACPDCLEEMTLLRAS